MDETGRYEKGLTVRRAVLGDAHVDRSLAKRNAFNEEFQALMAQIRRYRNWSVIERTFTRARNAAEQELRELDLSSPQIAQFQRLLSLLRYPHQALRTEPATLAASADVLFTVSTCS